MAGEPVTRRHRARANRVRHRYTRRRHLRSSADLQSPGLASAAQGEFSFSETAAHFCESRCRRAGFRRVYALLVRKGCFRTVSEWRFALESHSGTVVYGV
jgi:hypothetical protein